MEDKVVELLEDFRDKMDEIFIGETPKLTGEIDQIYDCDIYIWRHPGMGNSKQLITGNQVSIMTATASYLEQLLIQGITDEKQLKEMFDMVIDTFKRRDEKGNG